MNPGLSRHRERPSDVQAPAPRKSTIDGIISLEHDVAQPPNHVILRYGMFYGPGTWYDANGVMAEKVRTRALPATDGVMSFLHVEDAANAVLQALDWPTGPVNIVDDEPAAGTSWPVYADARLLQHIKRGASAANAALRMPKPGRSTAGSRYIPRGEQGSRNR